MEEIRYLSEYLFRRDAAYLLENVQPIRENAHRQWMYIRDSGLYSQ